MTPVGLQLGMAYRDLAQVYRSRGDTALAAEASRKFAELDRDRVRDPFTPRERPPK